MRSEKGSAWPASTELGERFLLLCRMTDEMMRSMSPADRDRMLQEHLAAARGPGRNFLLLCQMSDALAGVRRERLALERDTHE